MKSLGWLNSLERVKTLTWTLLPERAALLLLKRRKRKKPRPPLPMRKKMIPLPSTSSSESPAVVRRKTNQKTMTTMTTTTTMKTMHHESAQPARSVAALHLGKPPSSVEPSNERPTMTIDFVPFVPALSEVNTHEETGEGWLRDGRRGRFTDP